MSLHIIKTIFTRKIHLKVSPLIICLIDTILWKNNNLRLFLDNAL